MYPLSAVSAAAKTHLSLLNRVAQLHNTLPLAAAARGAHARKIATLNNAEESDRGIGAKKAGQNDGEG